MYVFRKGLCSEEALAFKKIHLCFAGLTGFDRQRYAEGQRISE